jgi:N-acetylglucosamine malate deacetylase 2
MGPDEPHSSGTILIVAAHPDDETIGAGARLREWRERVRIVHVTDGAPRNLADARNAGCTTREEYATVRSREVMNAVALAGICPEQCRTLGIADQEASFALAEITRHVSALIDEIRPAIVLTHPYEGGHPDHDSCAFAVHTAAAAHPELAVWEFASYHAGPSGMVTGQFLHDTPHPVFTYSLSAAERQRKREMFNCFATQLHMLANFGLEQESFRLAPVYDFTKPPHEGILHYENCDWGMTGSRWRDLAASILREMELAVYASNGS